MHIRPPLVVIAAKDGAIRQEPDGNRAGVTGDIHAGEAALLREDEPVGNIGRVRQVYWPTMSPDGLIPLATVDSASG